MSVDEGIVNWLGEFTNAINEGFEEGLDIAFSEAIEYIEYLEELKNEAKRECKKYKIICRVICILVLAICIGVLLIHFGGGQWKIFGIH